MAFYIFQNPYFLASKAIKTFFTPIFMSSKLSSTLVIEPILLRYTLLPIDILAQDLSSMYTDQ